MVKISVIIPTWNRKKHLRNAIQSVLAQLNVSIEILVCDDGSNDGTCEMVANWPDARVRLVTGPRAGRPAIPRNRGLVVAQGEWIAFLDDDDIWLPDKLQIQLENATQKNALAVCSNALRHIPGINPDLCYFEAVSEILSFPDLIKNNFIITSSVMFHRSLLPYIIGFPENQKYTAIEDYALWLRISSLTHFLYVDKPLLIYTDDPIHSIRNQKISVQKQKFYIFTNWLCWAKVKALGKFGGLVLLELGKTYFVTFYAKLKKYMGTLCA